MYEFEGEITTILQLFYEKGSKIFHKSTEKQYLCNSKKLFWALNTEN